MQVVLRLDSGDSIGSGHRVRTEALARVLEDSIGARCRLFTRGPVDSRFDTLAIPEGLPPEEEGAFLRAVDPVPDLLLADLHRPTQGQIDGLIRGPRRTVHIDDESPLRFEGDLLVNPNLNDAFSHERGPRTEYLRGAEFLLLRDQFESLPRHATRPECRELLICFGGGDSMAAIERAVACLAGSLPPGLEQISVLVGAKQDLDRLRGLLPDDPIWRAAAGVTDVAARMQAADLGLLAGGTLLYEAAASGLPCLVVSLNAAQEREATAVDGIGAAHHLGGVQDLRAPRLGEALDQLAPPEIRAAMSSRGQALVDGRGRRRVAERIAALLA